MKKLLAIALLSITGLNCSLHAIATQRKIKQADGKEVTLDETQFEERKAVLPEKVKVMMEAGGEISLPNLTQNDLEVLTKVLPLIKEEKEKALKEHFTSMLKNKKYEDYDSLLVTADYLGIDFLLTIASDLNNENLLIWAKENNIEPLEALFKLQKKYPHISIIDVDHQEEFGWPALMKASAYGHEKIVELLLNAGASVDMQNDFDTTSLMWASKGGYKGIVKMLLKAGAAVNQQDNAKDTALIWASNEDHKEIVEILLIAGSAVDIPGRGRLTALMGASYHGFAEIVKILLTAGADRTLKNVGGKTAFDIAKNEEIKQLLQEE